MGNLKYTILFGGGAIRGMAYVGTMRALEELGIEYDILSGSSVGSVMATLVACGYKSYELENLFMKVNFDLFKDIHFGIGKAFALSRGGVFIDWLNELIARKVSSENKNNLPFKDLEQKLVVITTNLNEFKTQEFSQDITPDFEIAKAVRISSSMPGLLAPYKYNDAELVDGDLQKASPMWRLSDTLKNSESRILEFRLEGECRNKDFKTPIAFINNIYSCVTDVATDFVSEIYGGNDRYDIIRINTGDIFFADFNLDKESRRRLVESGYEQTMKYFKEVLPAKKEVLDKVYSEIFKHMKKAYKGLRSNNVEEVQWWLGYIFTTLCENKELVDIKIYEAIVDLKNTLEESVSTILFVHNRFKNRSELEEKMREVLNILDERIAELRMFIGARRGKYLSDKKKQEEVEP